MSELMTRFSDAARQLALPTFDRPAWLVLIPVLCALAWWATRGSLAGWESRRQWAHLAIRCLVIALFGAALAAPNIRWRAQDVAVVAIVDVSDSVPIGQRRLGDAFLSASLEKKRPHDRLGTVTVARDALVQSLPSERAEERPAGSLGPVDASELSEGVELARALLPSDVGGRLLLITDGNETAGSLASLALRLRSAGVPIDVAGVEYDRSRGVRVEEVVAPAWVREGDTIAVRVVIRSGEPAMGRLTLLLDGEPLDLSPDEPGLSAQIALDAGVQVLTQQVRLPPGPVHRIEGVFEPEGRDAPVTQLLRAEGVVFTSDRGRVLVLAEDAAAVEPFVQAATANNLNVEVRRAEAAPIDLAEWSGYDAIVLFDEPASNFSQAQQRDMARAAHDGGSGLVMVGGPNGFGAGGWIGSPLADALPVLLDPPSKRQLPMGALALIIDRSGSMGMPVAGTGLMQQQIANEAAILGVRALSSLDQVTVVAFSGETEVVVPLTKRANGDEVVRRIRSIGPGGGTVLFPAIDAAATELAKSPAGVKHVIIMSDGETVGDPQEGLKKAEALKQKGVTLSTIAIGDQPNDNLLKWLAVRGGGRYYAVQSENSRAKLPQVFIKEAQTVSRTLIWEGAPFSPTVTQVGGSLRGLESSVPPIKGYVVTADRGGFATVALRGQMEDPILAQWQYGLGRVTAYTSDAAGRWNSAWLASETYEAFWGQQLKWVMRPGGDPNARFTLESHGDRTKLVLSLLDDGGAALNFASIKARRSALAAGAGGADEAEDVNFRQVGPGRYEAEVEAAATRTHIVSLRYDTPSRDGVLGRSGAVRVPIPGRAVDEFRQPAPNAALLRGIAADTGGRVYRLDASGVDLWVREGLRMPESTRPVWMMVAAAAIGLFLLDVAARRITIDVRNGLARLRRLVSREGPANLASLAALSAAKGRTVAKTERAAEDALGVVETRYEAPAAPAIPMPPVAKAEAPLPVRRPEAESADAGQEEGGDDMIARLRAAKKRSLPPEQERD